MEKKILHITTAKGPLECQLAAGKILASMLHEFRTNGLKAEVLQRTAGQENGTVTSALIEVQGMDIQRVIQPWIGTIQWIQKSPYRPNFGRKNWFVGVFELNEPTQNKWSLHEFQIQAVRSSGAGGQHVNKVSSAVRVTHAPTGISVFVQESRSQLQNKKIAMERIETKLENHFGNTLAQMENDTWSQHYDLERGNPVKVFSGIEFKPKKQQKDYRNKRIQLKKELLKEIRV